MIESYDGLCGNIPTFATSSLQIRCKYDLNHKGPCSYEKYRPQFQCRAVCTSNTDSEEGFINSVCADLTYSHGSILISSSGKVKKI